MRRVPAVVAVVIGVVLVVGVFAMSGFSRSRSGENLIDDAQGSVGKTGIVRFRADLEELKGAAGDVTEKVFPAYASALGLSKADFDQTLQSDFPAIHTAVVVRGAEILGSIEKGVANLEAHQGDYEAADDIPVPGVPVTLMPWGALATGLGLVALGVLAWRLPGHAPVVAIGVIGLVLVAFTLGSSLPNKAKRSERLVHSLNISTEVATKTRDQFDTARRGGLALSGFLTNLAEARHETPDAFLAVTLPRDFPRLARIITDGKVFDRIEGEVKFREQHVDEFADVKDLPMQTISWLFVGFGILLAAAAGGAFAGRPRNDLGS
jgi:hypothetical protein